MGDPRDELDVDAVCARCAVPIVEPASAVRRDGGLYCCPNCARAAAPTGAAAPPGGDGCSHCGAPVVDRTSAVVADGELYCCANCAAVPREVEPPVV